MKINLVSLIKIVYILLSLKIPFSEKQEAYREGSTFNAKDNTISMSIDFLDMTNYEMRDKRYQCKPSVNILKRTKSLSLPELGKNLTLVLRWLTK